MISHMYSSGVMCVCVCVFPGREELLCLVYLTVTFAVEAGCLPSRPGCFDWCSISSDALSLFFSGGGGGGGCRHSLFFQMNSMTFKE